jgi:rare lipoprotein A
VKRTDRLVVLGLAALLAACSSSPQRKAPAQPVAVPPPPAPSAHAGPPDIASVPDAVPRYELKSRHGNPPFYDIQGKRYFVLAKADGYVERGVASWYGPTFHGANTSMGEQYDMYAMTAAHKTLPLPAYARVTNLKNGRSVVVRINDRGPFVANRIIDLSYTAAAKLDMLREGTTLVEVRALTPAAPDTLTRTAELPPPDLYMQAGAFADEANAERLLARLRAAGLTGAAVLPPLAAQSHLYRVRVGPIASVAQYDELFARLSALGITDARLAPD